jgi:hypothetical protein
VAVKVKKLDHNGHDDGQATHESATSISANAGVLFVNKGSGVNTRAVAIYQSGFWTWAEVTETPKS